MTDPDSGDLVPLADGVFAGVDTTTGEAYALKVYPGRLDRHGRAELSAELGRAAALPGRVALILPDHLGEAQDGRFAVRMELCAQSLTELVDTFGPLSVPDALALGSALADALVAIHQAGLVHGGVTPGNVLFRPAGDPVLSDLGLTLRRAFPRDSAKHVDHLPPETLRDGTIDERSDLYGLGVVLYLALSGKSPHAGQPGEQPQERMLRVLDSPVPPLARDDLPPGLAQLLGALLAKNPDARPIDATTVATRLGTMAGPRPVGEDVPAARGTPPGPAVLDVTAPRPSGQPILEFGPQTPVRRSRDRTGLVLGVVGAVLVLAALGALLWLNRPTEFALPQQSSGAPATASSAPRAVQLDLLDAADLGEAVDLTWRSSQPMDFAVVIRAEGSKEPQVVSVRRDTKYRAPVNPVGGYCFSIRGSDGVQIYESQPKPIRNATCRR